MKIWAPGLQSPCMCTHIQAINAHRYIHTTAPEDGVQVREEEARCPFNKGERESEIKELLLVPSLCSKVPGEIITCPNYSAKNWPFPGACQSQRGTSQGPQLCSGSPTTVVLWQTRWTSVQGPFDSGCFA